MKAQPCNTITASLSLSSQETYIDQGSIEGRSLYPRLLNISMQSHFLIDSCHFSVFGTCSTVRLSSVQSVVQLLGVSDSL